MADLVKQYRQELELELRRSMSAYAAQLTAEEVENHLRQRIAALIELGSSHEVAQLEAIEALGPTSNLAREFGQQAGVLWTLGPVQGNMAAFLLMCVPFVLHDAFLRNEWVNGTTILLWGLVPAFCRRWPIWGFVAGVVVLELAVVLPQGRFDWLRELIGMTVMISLTGVCFMLGWAARVTVKRVKSFLAVHSQK